MQRFSKIVFVVSVLMSCWFCMMAVHELGHVIGALLSGGTIERVVLRPTTISQTFVSPNPMPLLVVWLGPGIGCVVPLILFWAVPEKLTLVHKLAGFFAGFCLIANDTYISIGAFEQIGDCKEMLRHGTPAVMLFLFGTITVPVGFYIWHRLGSIREMLTNDQVITTKHAMTSVGFLILTIASMLVFSG